MFDIERDIREKILETFPKIKEMAFDTTCKRKGVGATIIEITGFNHPKINFVTYSAINGHSGDGTGNVCQNIVGGCGCAHSEPRVIMEYLKFRGIIKQERSDIRTILLSTYSACVNCANIIVDSGIIDAVAYEIHAEYWDTPPRNASKIIEAAMPHWTKAQIIDDIYGQETVKIIL
jgi:deoxycytidylate deaminase